MPTLKQLSCSIELTHLDNRPLKEYGTQYADGSVETYVAIPALPAVFNIHLTSNGYTAPGLSMFVFIDGDYQCNRNRTGLVLPDVKGKILSADTEVDFRVRAKEEFAQNGGFIGRGWMFENLSQERSSDDQNSLGVIDILVLRCYDEVTPLPGDVQPNRATRRNVANKAASPANVESESASEAEDKEAKSQAKPKARVTEQISAIERNSSPGGESEIGGLFSLFDGPTEEHSKIQFLQLPQVGVGMHGRQNRNDRSQHKDVEFSRNTRPLPNSVSNPYQRSVHTQSKERDIADENVPAIASNPSSASPVVETAWESVPGLLIGPSSAVNREMRQDVRSSTVVQPLQDDHYEPSRSHPKTITEERHPQREEFECPKFRDSGASGAFRGKVGSGASSLIASYSSHNRKFSMDRASYLHSLNWNRNEKVAEHCYDGQGMDTEACCECLSETAAPRVLPSDKPGDWDGAVTDVWLSQLDVDPIQSARSDSVHNHAASGPKGRQQSFDGHISRATNRNAEATRGCDCRCHRAQHDHEDDFRPSNKRRSHQNVAQRHRIVEVTSEPSDHSVQEDRRHYKRYSRGIQTRPVNERSSLTLESQQRVNRERDAYPAHANERRSVFCKDCKRRIGQPRRNETKHLYCRGDHGHNNRLVVNTERSATETESNYHSHSRQNNQDSHWADTTEAPGNAGWDNEADEETGWQDDGDQNENKSDAWEKDKEEGGEAQNPWDNWSQQDKRSLKSDQNGHAPKDRKRGTDDNQDRENDSYSNHFSRGNGAAGGVAGPSSVKADMAKIIRSAIEQSERERREIDRNPSVHIDEEQAPWGNPPNRAEGRNAYRHVNVGRGVAHEQKLRQPVYMDTVEMPYAIFRFHYGSREAVQKVLGIEVEIENDMDLLKGRLQDMTRDQLIDELLHLQSPMKGRSSNHSDQLTGQQNGTSQRHREFNSASDVKESIENASEQADADKWEF